MIPYASRFNETFSVLVPAPIVDDRGGMRLNFTVAKTHVRGKKVMLSAIKVRLEALMNDQLQDHQYCHIHLNKAQCGGLVQGKSRLRDHGGQDWDVLTVWHTDNLLMTLCIDAEPSQP